ncbi:MAG: hypothetical protein J6N49_05990 [Alphaproteobacteria bacterium]|nr:hypothetical protein [Alphaproteobacteria bacterium]
MIRLFLILSLLMMPINAQAISGLNNKFCVVDIQKVVVSSKDIQKLKIERDGQVTELKEMADTANEKIKAEKDDDARKKISEKNLAEINAKKEEFDKVYATALQASDKKLNDIIRAVCIRKGGDIAFNKDMVIFGGIDITDDIINETNKHEEIVIEKTLQKSSKGKDIFNTEESVWANFLNKNKSDAPQAEENSQSRTKKYDEGLNASNYQTYEPDFVFEDVSGVFYVLGKDPSDGCKNELSDLWCIPGLHKQIGQNRKIETKYLGKIVKTPFPVWSYSNSDHGVDLSDTGSISEYQTSDESLHCIIEDDGNIEKYVAESRNKKGRIEVIGKITDINTYNGRLVLKPCFFIRKVNFD